MQGLIHVCLGHGNIVLKPHGQRTPYGMHCSKHCITISHRGHDDAHGNDIIEFFKGFGLGLHLFIDGVNMLGPPFNFRRNAQRRYFFLEHSDDACNIFLSLFARRIQLMGHIEICFRIQVFERQILKLPFKCADAQPICQRSIDLEGFPSPFPAVFPEFYSPACAYCAGGPQAL